MNSIILIQKMSSTLLLLLLFTLLTVACQPIVPPTPVTTPAPTVTSQAAEHHEGQTQEEQSAEEPHLVARRLVETITQPVPLPPDWQVAPCAGEAPFLCVQGDGFTTAMELFAFAMPAHADFQTLLAEHGLTVETLDTTSEAYAAAAVPILQAFAADHLATIEADRQTTYGGTVSFVRLAPQPIPFGQLPGLQYGFVLSSGNHQVLERVISAAAFDGDYLYILSAVYDPAYEPSFPTDEALQTFAPYLPQVLSRLQLPAMAY